MRIAICAEDGCDVNATCQLPNIHGPVGSVLLYCDHHAEVRGQEIDTRRKTRRGGA